MQETYVKSFDNTDIFVTLWDDVSSPVGVIMIAHGVSEYARRYDGFAKYLNSRGYIVFCDDHRAHGRTEKKEELGRHSGDVFSKTVKDLVFFREMLKEKYGLPVFLIGHSYGSFLAQAFAQEGTDIKAIALLGSGKMNGLAKLGKILTAPLKLIAPNWRPKAVNILTDKLFSFKGDSGRSQWLTRDKDNRRQFIDDEYCGCDLSINFDYAMMSGVARVCSKKSLAKLNPATSIGIFSGSDDPIGAKGRGVKKLEEMYKRQGVPVECRIYEGMRHEIHNEIGKEAPMKDVADFFDRFIIYAQPSLADLGV